MLPHFQKILDAMPTRSAWDRGVKATAFDLLEQMEENNIPYPTESDLLNGAEDWSQWAYGGCGLAYDAYIAERYCTPSELKKRRGGEWQPNRYEQWLDVEARAARQAARHILRQLKKVSV